MDIETGKKNFTSSVSGMTALSSSDDDISSIHKKRRTTSFVDYVAPKKELPPPAKYKLWLMVAFLVYFAEWFSAEAGVVPWIERTFRLSSNSALLVFFCIVVGVLVYTTLDLLMLVCRIKIKGKWYGLETWLKQPRIQWVHEYENVCVGIIQRIVYIFEEGFAIFNSPPPPPPNKEKDENLLTFESSDDDDDFEDHECILKIQNEIRPDKLKEFEKWRKDYTRVCGTTRPGLKKVEHEVINGNIQICYLTFESIDYLNAFMTSPVRARLIRKLEPLLKTPSVVQLRKDRHLPDAFTDLCNGQGQCVPPRPPKKWKVWWITTFALWLTAIVVNATMPQYYSDWQIEGRARASVNVIITTFLNSYVFTPFLTMIFGNWLVRKENEMMETKEPWRTCNDGVGTVWFKAFVTIAFYGGCALGWALR